MMKAAYVYDEVLSRHVLREGHALQPTRLQVTYELLQSYGAFEAPQVVLVRPRPATEVELLTFHRGEYVSAVEALSRGEITCNPLTYNFSDWGDNPVSPGMYEASALAVGASLVAAELVAEGKVAVAFNPGGGMHHAAANCASGFCIFNDVVITIKHLLARGLRVAYVDIDAHHGDGVQDAFYDSDRVLTISLHESGRYLFPGTGEVSETGSGQGEGYAVNVPLGPHTTDDVYLWAFEEIVPPLVRAFAPDVLVTQLGCDTHYQDPLTHLALTTSGYMEVVKRLGGLCPRWVAVGGGGYEMGVVARCWTLAFGVMMGVELPDEIPGPFRSAYGLHRLRDDVEVRVRGDAEQARRYAREAVAGVKKRVVPRHGL